MKYMASIEFYGTFCNYVEGNTPDEAFVDTPTMNNNDKFSPAGSMATVKDYLDFGLEFIVGDMIYGRTGDACSDEVSLFERCLEEPTVNRLPIYSDKYTSRYALKEWTPSSFAWRNNLGVKPEYHGDVEIVRKIDAYNGVINFEIKNAADVDWRSHGCSNPVVKWRPIVLFVNKEPIFTQAMADAGELPPDGSLYLDDDGQVCSCIGYACNSNIIVGEMIEHPPINGMTPLSVCNKPAIKPLETRTKKQKAVDNALSLDEFSDNRSMLSRREFCEKLYDAKLLSE